MQIQIGIVAAAADIVMDIVAGKVVVQQPGGDAVIPQFGRDISARTIAHKSLRHGEVQALLTDVETAGRLFDHLRHRHAGIGREGIHTGHGGGIDAHAGQLAAGQAGGQTVVVLSALKGDIAGGHKAVIQVDIDAIGARRHLLTLFETRQIRHRGRIIGEETRVKVKFRLRGKGLHGKQKGQREPGKYASRSRRAAPRMPGTQAVRSIFQM